ncbi:SpoIIE family protein phosphatase [Pontiellaceae bacterium B12227]|nr:SpoIIE family protein phosphatase [Pontiellaceae bacterium B12227]
MSLNDSDYTQLLDNLMVNLTDVIYFKDLKSRFIRVNQACLHKHGFESEEFMIGKTDFDLWSEVHASEAFAIEQEIIRTGETRTGFEEREVWPDGRVTWASSTKMPLRNPEGEIIGTFGVTRDITRKKEADLRIRLYADEINAIKEEMENDVRMAGKLQKSFFSAAYPSFPEQAGPDERCVEFLHRFILNQQVSGDYCAIQRISEHEAGILICDVQGVGIRSALGTALVRGIAQELMPLARDPGAYLSRMNALLIPLLNQEEVLLDTSACYLTLDVRTGCIRMANANHPLPILFHDGMTAQWLGVDSRCGPGLGDTAGVIYETQEIYVAVDDAVVLFTDGLFTLKNNMDDPYGLKRLLDSAHSFAGEPLEDIFQGLEDDALAFSREQKFSDDVCMVGFHLKQLLV